MNTNFDDEIDLRAILLTLWKGKWWIIGATLLLAVAVYAYSKLALPKQYEATALVIITRPSLIANLDSSIQTTSQLPDSKSLADLAMVDDLLLAVYQAPVVAEAAEVDDITLSGLRGRLAASLVGTNQIRLVATDTDPQRAALLANTWAEQLTLRLNTLFGTDSASVDDLQAQASQARLDWDSAEQSLLESLSQSQLDSLEVRLQQARDSLKVTLNAIDTLDQLISNAQIMQTRLQEQNASQPLTLQDALSLVSLHQQAVGQLQGFQFVISADTAMLGADYTVTDARADLQTLVAALQTQRQEFVTRAETTTITVTTLATDLENANYQLTQLTVQRDLSLQAYQALSSQAVEVQITLSQNDQVAKIAGLALPPEEPSGPRSAINGVIAGALGFLVSTALVFLLNWWKTQPDAPIAPNQPASPSTPPQVGRPASPE